MGNVKGKSGKNVVICVSWVNARKGHLPSNAVEAGYSCFVIRAKHNGEYIPGKFVTGHKGGYVSYAGEEILKSNYQVLVDTSILKGTGLRWKSTSNGTIPVGALSCGTDDALPLYIARSKIEGEVVVGKFFPEHKCAYVPHGGKEHTIYQFDVLCCVL